MSSALKEISKKNALSLIHSWKKEGDIQRWNKVGMYIANIQPKEVKLKKHYI